MNPLLTLLPAPTCILCDKTLSEIGGRRILCHHFQGILLSRKPLSGGHAKKPRRSVQIDSDPTVYLVLWGSDETWTEDRVNAAIENYANGFTSWFCQVCGGMTCDKCGSPYQRPMGAELLKDDGSSSHLVIFGASPGCVNAKCSNHKK